MYIKPLSDYKLKENILFCSDRKLIVDVAQRLTVTDSQGDDSNFKTQPQLQQSLDFV